MAKKQSKERPEDQAKRFEEAVQDLINAGELNPIEADSNFDMAMQKIATKLKTED